MVRGAQRTTEEPMTTPVLPHRPPRPRIPAREILDRAAAFGISVRDINDAFELDGDLVVDTGAGVQTIYVSADRPDGAGQHGPLLLRGAPGYAEPHGMRKFVPRDGRATTEPWTVKDLEWAGRQLTPPSLPTMVADGFGGFGQWLFEETDAPVRAYRLWTEIARRNREITMAEAVANFPVAALCRQLILDSRWLAEDEAATL
jgi:hypothetical protein